MLGTHSASHIQCAFTCGLPSKANAMRVVVPCVHVHRLPSCPRLLLHVQAGADTVKHRIPFWGAAQEWTGRRISQSAGAEWRS